MLKFGNKHIQLLKLLGIFVVLASLILMLASLSDVFLRLKQANSAMSDKGVALQTLGLKPEEVTPELVIGYILTPTGWLVLWLALFLVGVLIYRAGMLFIPIEEEIEEIKEQK